MKQRIITGIIGAVLVCIMLFFRNTWLLPVAFIALNVVALWEMFVSTHLVKNLPLITVCMLFAMVVPLLSLSAVMPYAFIICIVFALAFFAVCIFQFEKLRVAEMCAAFTMTAIIPAALSCILWLNRLPLDRPDNYKDPDGLFFILLSLGGAWICDIGAYFVGSFFGKHKLCPNISPKKTIEGALGGVVANLLFFMILGLVWHVAVLDSGETIQYGWMALLSVVLALVSMLGDLTFSVIKRDRGIKDYGDIMPGHGGVLDRFDSVIFVAPVLYAATVVMPLIVR